MLGTLRSVLSQTYPDLEVVVADDGSDDRTYEHLQRLTDPRLKVVRSEAPQGVAAARNMGANASSGQILGFCDDDDFWHPDKLSKQIEALKQSPSRWAVSGSISVDNGLQFLKAAVSPSRDEFLHRLEFGNKVRGGCSNAIMERSLFYEAGGFDTELSMLADWDMWIRLANISKSPALSDHLGLLYVHHESQMSLDMSDIKSELTYIRKKHDAARQQYRNPPYERTDIWIVRRLLAAGQRSQALKWAMTHSSGYLGAAAGLCAIGATLALPHIPSWLQRSSPYEAESLRTIAEVEAVLSQGAEIDLSDGSKRSETSCSDNEPPGPAPSISNSN